MRLTRRQRAVLVIMGDAGPWTPDTLGARLESSPLGAARTASSLVTHGLALRHRHGGHVAYTITRRGLHILDHHQQELAAD